jgi:hypothetical protein
MVGNEIVALDDPKTAIKKLIDEKWDILFLDHDLGDQVMVDSGEGTGYEVALWLSRNRDFQPKVVIVHSLNPVGAANICGVLPSSSRVPFAWAMSLRKVLSSALSH